MSMKMMNMTIVKERAKDEEDDNMMKMKATKI